MYKVFGMKKGDCDANESHADREVMQVEDLVAKITLSLCPKCFLAQLKLRSKGKKTEEPALFKESQ